jgi:glycosyltransferase involved in cell wall biosynthesis
MEGLPAPVTRRLDGYRRRLAHEYNMWSCRRTSARNTRRYEKWIARLRQQRPDVLIGTNLAWGGVRHHIHAIKQYSSLRLEVAPPEELVNDFSNGLRKLFSEFAPTGVQAVHSHVFPWFIEWCAKQQKAGTRWIHTYHLNYFPEHAKDGLLGWQMEVNDSLINDASHANVRLSVSRWQQAFLKKTHGLETQYLPNGVDVALCDQSDPARFRTRVGNGEFILFAGRNDPVKNPADFARLAARLPKQRFVMIGQGLSREVLEKEWDVEAPANLAIHGQTTHRETLDAIAACSALVVTSKREGLPTLVLEAMAHQKPIVVPEEAGCLEAIGDGEFGFIYQQGNVDDLAEKVLAALGDAKKCAGARERVLAEYDWRIVAPKLDTIYRNGPLSSVT